MARIVGAPGLHLYAATRGDSLEAFLKRRAPGARYCVAGTQATELAWDRGGAKAASRTQFLQ